MYVFNKAYAFFSDLLYRSICCWYSIELPQLVDICFYEADCNLKTTKLHDCVKFWGVCSNEIKYRVYLILL